MKPIPEQFKQLLFTAMFMLAIIPGYAQVKHTSPAKKKQAAMSPQLKEFFHLAANADIEFVFPKGFEELKAPDNEDISFDYAMGLPGKAFEIWLQVKSEKENWASYIRSQNNKNAQLANPDSLYASASAAQAISLSGDKNSLVRNISPEILTRYHADEGKSYLLTLPDTRLTKRFRYALLIALHKNHTGTIVAICFTNDKGPEFFKNIDLAGDCLKFKS